MNDGWRILITAFLINIPISAIGILIVKRKLEKRYRKLIWEQQEDAIRKKESEYQANLTKAKSTKPTSPSGEAEGSREATGEQGDPREPGETREGEDKAGTDVAGSEGDRKTTTDPRPTGSPTESRNIPIKPIEPDSQTTEYFD